MKGPRKGGGKPGGGRSGISKPGGGKPGGGKPGGGKPGGGKPGGGKPSGRPPSRGSEGSARPATAIRAARRPPPRSDEETGLRSFDGAPRRRRDNDWDERRAEREGLWTPATDDVDLDAIREEPVRRARPARDRPEGDRPPRRPPERRDAAPVRPKAELRAEATETLQTGVQTLLVIEDETGMRLDRFIVARFPQVSFSHVQRIVRKGEVRVDGKRADTSDRLEAGQKVRLPPLRLDAPRPVSTKAIDDARSFLQSLTLYEDADVLVIAKPAGLAVQGGSGTKKHVDGMLAALTDADGQRPRLVHRLDKDTSGCLLVAKTRFAASALAKTFRTRSARKIYWAVVAGVPKPRQGRVSTYLAKEEREDESHMRIAKHGEKGAIHAVTYYAVVDSMAQKLAWLSMKPVTGRTHQLRVHAAEIGHPIIGDPKYFAIENWELPGGLQQKLHLHARRIVVPHPRGRGTIDVSAPLPPHMEQTFNLLGWDASRYDPIVEAPED